MSIPAAMWPELIYVNVNFAYTRPNRIWTLGTPYGGKEEDLLEYR